MKNQKLANIDANLLVKDLHQQLHQIKQSCLDESVDELLPKIKRLRKRVDKLRWRTQQWGMKRDAVRDSFKRVRDRAALGYKKKQLLDLINNLRTQLKTSHDAVKLKSTRLQLRESVANAERLEICVDMLKEQLVDEKLLRGPKWLCLLHKDNRPSPRTPYPWQYVYNSMKTMAESNVPASKMPKLQKASFSCWTGRMDMENMCWGV